MNYVNTFYNIPIDNDKAFFRCIKNTMVNVANGDRIVLMGIEFDDYDIELQVEKENDVAIISYYVCRCLTDDNGVVIGWESDDWAEDDRTEFVLNCETIEQVNDDMIRALCEYVEGKQNDTI